MGGLISTEQPRTTQPSHQTTEEDVKDLARTKNRYYQLPETPFDNFPIFSASETERIVSQMPKIPLHSFFSETEFETAAKQFVQQLQEEGFVILQLQPEETPSLEERDFSTEFRKMSQNILEASKQFFSLPLEEKRKISKPGEEEGKRNAFSGYSEIHFPNNENVRDEERRDVFQVRLGETQVPWPNADFENSVLDFYRFQWTLSLRMLEAIAQNLNIPASSFVDLLSPVKDTEQQRERDLSELAHHPETSLNSNLCLFRYHDVVGYKEEQKCMVHVDNGLVTILGNWSTAGALQVLSYKYQHFIPIDLFLDPTQHLIVYCGKSMQFVTNGEIQGQIHRVVRQPQAVRYSFPFELKPSDSAVLRRFPQLPKNQNPGSEDHPISKPKQGFVTELSVTDSAQEYIFDALMRQISWQQVMQKVARADSFGSDVPWYQDFYSTDMN